MLGMRILSFLLAAMITAGGAGAGSTAIHQGTGSGQDKNGSTDPINMQEITATVERGVNDFRNLFANADNGFAAFTDLFDRNNASERQMHLGILNGKAPSDLPGMQTAEKQTPPELPDGAQMNDGQTPPELPDGAQMNDGQTPPELPDGAPADNAQAAPANYMQNAPAMPGR